jgi:hypothetical protein
MKFLTKEELVKEFKPVAREEKIKKYGDLIDEYNHLVNACKELKTVNDQQANDLLSTQNNIEIVNAVLRKLEYPERVKDFRTFGATISNFLWKYYGIRPPHSLP